MCRPEPHAPAPRRGHGQGFQASLCVATVTAPVGLAVGWWGPKGLAALGLALTVMVAGLFLVGDPNDPLSNEIRQHALAEAGTFGVMQDIASIHLLRAGPMAGLLVGLVLRWLRLRRVAVPSR